MSSRSHGRSQETRELEEQMDTSATEIEHVREVAISCLARQSKVDPSCILDSTTLFELGLDSLGLATAIEKIEEELNSRFSPSGLIRVYEASTVEEFVLLLFKLRQSL